LCRRKRNSRPGYPVAEEGADAHIDKPAKNYLGQDKYPYARPGEVLVEIEPKSISG